MDGKAGYRDLRGGRKGLGAWGRIWTQRVSYQLALSVPSCRLLYFLLKTFSLLLLLCDSCLHFTLDGTYRLFWVLCVCTRSNSMLFKLTVLPLFVRTSHLWGWHSRRLHPQPLAAGFCCLESCGHSMTTICLASIEAVGPYQGYAGHEACSVTGERKLTLS